MFYRMTDNGFGQNGFLMQGYGMTQGEAFCAFMGTFTFDFALGLFSSWIGNAIVQPDLKFMEQQLDKCSTSYGHKYCPSAMTEQYQNAAYALMTGVTLGWLAYNALAILTCTTSSEIKKNPYSQSGCQSAWWNYSFTLAKISCLPSNSIASLVGTCFYYGTRQVTFAFIGAGALHQIKSSADARDLGLTNFVGGMIIPGAFVACKLIGVAFLSGKLTVFPENNYELTGSIKYCVEDGCPEIGFDCSSMCCPKPAERIEALEVIEAQEIDNESLREELLRREGALDQGSRENNFITTMFTSVINQVRNGFNSSDVNEADATVTKCRLIG